MTITSGDTGTVNSISNCTCANGPGTFATPANGCDPRECVIGARCLGADTCIDGATGVNCVQCKEGYYTVRGPAEVVEYS